MKKKIAHLTLIIAAVILLFYIVLPSKQSTSNGGFNRRFIDIKNYMLNLYEVKDSQYGFVSNSTEPLWVKSIRNPQRLFNFHNNNLVSTDWLISKNLSGNLDYFFYNKYRFVSNRHGVILRNSDVKQTIFLNKELMFDQSQAISPSSLIVRSKFNDPDSILKITKLNLSNNNVNVIKKYTLPHQKRLSFNGDGALHYDLKSSHLFYLYYYVGEFLCLDTNLNLVYKAKTIDTVKNVDIESKVKSSKIDNQSVQVLIHSKPPKIVNRYLTINDNKLYVLSRSISDNEHRSATKKNSSIDVYSIGKGKYLYSFYIPKYRNIKVQEFKISTDTMYVNYGLYIVTYKIKNKAFL